MIARRSVLVFTNSVVGAGLGYVAMILMARYMGAELVGARAYTLSIVFIGSILTRLGLPVTHARRLAQGEDVASSNGTFLLLKLVVTTIFAVVGFLTIWLWLGVLGNRFEDTTEAALTIGIFIVIAKSLRGIAVNTFRGLGHFIDREGTLFANTLVTVIATSWVAISYAVGADRWVPFPGFANWLAHSLGVNGPISFETALVALLGAYLLGEVASLILATAQFLFRRIPVGAPSKVVANEYIRQAIPLMMVNIAALTMANMDQIFIGYWWTAVENGYYEVTGKLSRLMLILASSINVVLMPYFARQFRDNDHTGIRRATHLVERFIAILAFPFVAFVWVYAPDIIHILLADEFLPATWILRILMLVVLVQSLTIPIRAKAIGKGETGLAARTTWTALAINLVLNVILIPQQLGPIPAAGMGPMGAAIATLIAVIYMGAVYRYRANQWTGHPIFQRSLGIQIGFAVLVGILAFWLAPLMPIVRFYHLFFAGAWFLALYLVGLIAVREVTKTDWHHLTSWMRP